VIADAEPARPIQLVLCLIPVIVGTWTFPWITGLLIARSMSAASWRQTPCTVIAATLRTKVMSGQHHIMTWWPDVVFRYRANGQDYRSNTYNFTDLPTPWYYGERGLSLSFHQGRTRHATSIRMILHTLFSRAT
jgi:hypothetical protein